MKSTLNLEKKTQNLTTQKLNNLTFFSLNYTGWEPSTLAALGKDSSQKNTIAALRQVLWTTSSGIPPT